MRDDLPDALCTEPSEPRPVADSDPIELGHALQQAAREVAHEWDRTHDPREGFFLPFPPEPA